MPNYCLFDRLPVELLHTLFEYFLVHEIFLTFSHVSDYVTAILLNYSAYRIDFKSIRKAHFDLVCRHIQPKQVISLTLSDDDDTPGLSNLFFSYFQIEQFTQLQSLTLIKIEFESLQFIFSNLNKLHQLRSLSFDGRSMRYRYLFQTIPTHYHLEKSINARVLSKLNRLNLTNGSTLTSIPLPHLRYLKLEKCSSDELKTIFHHASQLKSVRVCLDLLGSNFQLILPHNQLTQLQLEIQTYNISMSEIKQFLSKLPHLKHLELKASVMNDVVDGYQWQILATSLITFNFKFNISLFHINAILESFRTPFWLEEKRWFVAYQDDYLFSIPHFAPVHMDSRNLLHFYSTTSNHSVIFSHLKELTVNTDTINSNHRLTHIKTLVLKYPTLLEILESVVDLNQIEHLIIPSLNSLSIFIPLKYTLPQLYKLTVKNSVTVDMIKEIRRYRFEQILKLEISITDIHGDYIMEELFRLFPCTQHLIYNSSIQSKQTMIRFIDGFKHLSNVSFYVCSHSFIDRESKFCQNTNTIIQHSQRLIKNNFTCRIYHSFNNNLYSIHWWIAEHPSTYFQRKYWLPRRGYYWYRFKYILLPIFDNSLLLIQFIINYFVQFLIFLLCVMVIGRFSFKFDYSFLCFCLVNAFCYIIFHKFSSILIRFIRNSNICFVFIVCSLLFLILFPPIMILLLFLIKLIDDYILQ